MVSRLADRETELAEEEKTVFDWCKEGREDLLQSHLSPDNINTRDNEVRSLPSKDVNLPLLLPLSLSLSAAGDGSTALGV